MSGCNRLRIEMSVSMLVVAPSHFHLSQCSVRYKSSIREKEISINENQFFFSQFNRANPSSLSE